MNLRNLAVAVRRGPVAKHGPALLFAVACLLAFGSRPAGAAKIYPSAGSTSAAFLKLGVGARALGMGGAFTAVPGDPYAVYWNPASLAYLEGERNLSLFHNEYFQGLGQEYLLYTAPAAGGSLLGLAAPKSGVWGFGLDYFYVPRDMERRSGLNEADPLNPISPAEGKFGASDLAFSAAYGRRLENGYSAGLALKVIRQSIDGSSGGSAAADLGLARDFRWRGNRLTAGFSAQNLGPGLKLENKRYGLPLVFRAGLSGRLAESGALLSVDVEKPVDNYPAAAVGAEYPLTGLLALRSGYRYRLHGNEQGAWSGFSAGAGVAFDRVSFDYAFTPFGDLGNAHRFSLSLKFGEAPAAPAAAARGPLPGGVPVVYQVSRRALSMSARGVKYEFTAASSSSALTAFTFRTQLRGEPPEALTVIESGMPPELAPGPGSGLKPLRVWQPAGLPGELSGGLRFSFKLARAEAPAGKAVFLYREGGAWKESPADLQREDGEYYYFSSGAPAAPYYAAALKE